MNLDYAFFAETASTPPDGKLYVLGGGFSTIALESLPGRASFAVIAGFRFAAADTGVVHQVELRFLDAAEKLIVPPAQLRFQPAGPALDADREVTVPTVTYITPMFGEAGLYAAEYWLAERLLARIPLRIETREASPPPLTGRPN